MADARALTSQSGKQTEVADADGLLVGGSIDRATAGVLAIGDTTATSLTFGRTGVTATVPGTLVVTEGFSFDGPAMLLQEQAVDPTTGAAEGGLYTKDDAGVTQLFYRAESNGTVYQLTPTGAGPPVDITITDNTTNAFQVREAANQYININTTDISEAISLGNTTTNPDLTQLGSGQVTFNGNVDAVAGLDVTTAVLTAGAGLTVAAVLSVDVGASGTLAFTGSNIDLDPTATFTLDMDAAQTATITIADTLASALLIQEGVNAYIDVTTTTGTEAITFGNVMTNPDLTQLGSGQVSFSGNVDAANGLDVTTAALTAAAGLTVSGGAVTVTGSNIDLDPTGTFALDMDAAQTATITLSDNLLAAFLVREGANNYIEIDTNDGSEAVVFGNATTNPSFSFTGTGSIAMVGKLEANGGVGRGSAGTLLLGTDAQTTAITIGSPGMPLPTTVAGGLTVSAAAFTFTGTNIDLDPTSTFTLDMDAAQTATITIADTLASALLIQEGANAYLDVTTTTATEAITFGNATTNPSYSFLGSGSMTVAGDLTVTGTSNAAFIGADAGASAAVSAASKGRIRYNQTDQRFERSQNAAAYAPFGRNTFTFKLNGKPTVITGVDNAWIAPAVGTIIRVTMYRRTAGSAGSTTVDVNKNGTTIYTTQANRPSVTQASGNDQISTTTPDVTTFAQDDRFEFDIDVVESGNPQDVALIVTVVYA